MLCFPAISEPLIKQAYAVAEALKHL